DTKRARQRPNEVSWKKKRQMVEVASHEYWVACDQCNAWRLLPIGVTASNLPENWWCSRPGNNYYDVSEDETTLAVYEMNYKISSQNTRDTYHANSNTNSKTVPNGWKKNKSRPMVATPDMTSRFVPGDRLVSPLNESLMCLTKADRTLGIKDALPVNQFVDASSLRHEGVKQIEVKEVKESRAVVLDT
nr:CW-type zinc finger [Tanacetum cinerariifolium]